MSRKAPGEHYRKGITLADIFKKFPDDDAARECSFRCAGLMAWWFVRTATRITYRTAPGHKTMPYRCREKPCAKRFSVRTRTPMDSSNIGFQKWAVAVFLMTTRLKGVSSMKLHRDLGITQRSAWFMAHRIRLAMSVSGVAWCEVEIDETCVGGLEKIKHGNKGLRAGTGGLIGKTTVVGAKERAPGKVVQRSWREQMPRALSDSSRGNTDEGAIVYTDELASYKKIPRYHFAIRHRVKEFASGRVHTNGIESFLGNVLRGRTRGRITR